MSDNEDASTTTLVAVGGDEAKSRLCARCEHLDLSVDKFIIGNASSTATIARDPLRYESKRAEVKFRLKSGRSFKDFATLQELRENCDTCRFCDLVRRAIEHYSHRNIDDGTSCSLSWEVDGRQVEAGTNYVNSTRRVRLSWNETTGNAQEVYLVFVGPRDPLRPNSEATSRWMRETHFLGREFGEQKEKQALIKSWLDLCVQEHSEVCRDKHGTEMEFMELIKETYFGVVDVLDMQLKALPIKKGKPEAYVALSYVWGRKAYDELPYMTTRANIMTHIQHGGLETARDKLPRTIQDAILLVSRLGYRYIWIDSLCIVQDSDSSWQLNAQAMHLVYGNAHFTICAADGDSSAGLGAVNPILQAMRPDQSERDTIASVNGVEYEGAYDSQPMSAECAPGVRLMVTRPLEAVINDSVWNKRAWTFQERILSRRCLVFAEGRVYFQCRSTGISQDIYTDGKGSGWSLDRTNSPLRTLRELQQRPLWFYMKYVKMYTGRHLTKPRDILAAFEGISWLLERYMEAPSLFGLPTLHFDLALLWSPLETLRFRRPGTLFESDKKTCTQDDLGNCTCQIEQDSFGSKEFPTWSWSGWMGGRIEYQLGMIDGCLLNVHEWLKHHTWIQWYIRDQKGHLRPLWEILSQRMGRPSFGKMAETDDDERWKGYPRRGYQSHVTSRRPGQAIVIEEDVDTRYNERVMKQERRDRGSSPGNLYNSRNMSPPSVEYIQPIPLRPVPIIRRHSPSPDRGNGNRITTPPRERLSRVRPLSPRRRHSRYSDEDNINRRIYSTLRDVPSVPFLFNDDYHGSGSSSETSAEDDIVYSRVSNVHYTRTRSASHTIHNSGAEQPDYPAPGTSRAHWDEYGRVIQGDIPIRDTRMFHAILPDNPFGVIRNHSSGRNQSETQYMPILQFWTWRTELHVTIYEPSTESTVKQSNTGLCQCDIVDKEGDWCGSIVLDDNWIRERQGHIFQFIAISDAKTFTKEECPVWTYYIPKERDESEWDLYYVLLLQRNAERGLWERAGLGKTFQAAFREKTWDEIKLG